jgi:hypothetical protein
MSHLAAEDVLETAHGCWFKGTPNGVLAFVPEEWQRWLGSCFDRWRQKDNPN